MRSNRNLEFVRAEDLKQKVRAAAAAFDDSRKEWYEAASKIPDFPGWRTLLLYMEKDDWHDKRKVGALRRGLTLSKIELEVGTFDVGDERVLTDSELYSTINGLINDAEKSSIPKIIQLCAMHGTDEPRVVQEPHPPLEWNRFVDLMGACTLDRNWRVEILYNVPSAARLEQILGRLRRAEHAENHEVRAYGIEGSIPAMCPMIVGERHAFLATGHPRFYRAHTAIYFRAADKIEFVRRYWRNLWEHAYVIRSEAGIKWAEIKRLERELSIERKRRTLKERNRKANARSIKSGVK